MNLKAISHNLRRVQDRIQAAAERAGRPADAVRLVAVTKTVGMAEIRELHRLGVREMAENRVELAVPKRLEAPEDIVWHLIGPLQTRKAPEVVAHCACFDALDRMKAAEALQKRCEEQDRFLRVLVEVNVSGEESKHGFTPATFAEQWETLRGFDRLRVEGLMTMAPFGAPEATLRACFSALKRLADAHGLPEVSMGMTDDFETAIEEGSTQVRVGRALFEDV